MTKLMEKALEAIRELPEAEQDALARMILEAAGQASAYEPTAEELEAIDEGMADLRAGRIADTKDIEALLSRFA